MTDHRPRVSISRPANALPPPARRQAAKPRTRAPYSMLVAILTIASTSIAIFDLWLFAAGFVG